MDADTYISGMISRMRLVTIEDPTLMCITALYNLLCEKLTLCAVGCPKKELIKTAKDLHKGLMDHIEYLYDNSGDKNT